MRSEVIVRLCSRAPLSVRELSVLLDRSEAYVEDAIGPLLRSGAITPAPPDRYMSIAKPDEDDLPEVTERRPRFPNRWSNMAYVIAVGLVLVFSRAPLWILFAVAAGAALAWWHVSADSEQYRRYRELQPRRTRATEFMLLKSAVTVLEIAIVYLVTAAGF